MSDVAADVETMRSCLVFRGPVEKDQCLKALDRLAALAEATEDARQERDKAFYADQFLDGAMHRWEAAEAERDAARAQVDALTKALTLLATHKGGAGFIARAALTSVRQEQT